MKKRCVIVGGAGIRDYGVIRSLLREDDFCIYCDSGLRHLQGLGAQPDLVVGDFDSHENPGLQAETIVLPREKDDTDTVFAVKTAYARGFRDFLLLGAVGDRLDHTLANVYALLWLHRRGAAACAADDFSEMEIVSCRPVRIPDTFAYFSLAAVAGDAHGVTVKGAKYPLENGTIECDYQYGVSNEVLPGQTAEVSAADGELLLIRDRR